MPSWKMVVELDTVKEETSGVARISLAAWWCRNMCYEIFKPVKFWSSRGFNAGT